MNVKEKTRIVFLGFQQPQARLLEKAADKLGVAPHFLSAEQFAGLQHEARLADIKVLNVIVNTTGLAATETIAMLEQIAKNAPVHATMLVRQRSEATQPEAHAQDLNVDYALWPMVFADWEKLLATFATQLAS